MKKVLVFCLLTVFSAFYAVSAWGQMWTSGATTVTVSGSTITVSGSGAMADYASGGTDSKWGTHSGTVTTLVVEDGVTHIGAYAFQGFSALTTVTIPASVTSIGASAFKSCTHTTRINTSTPNNWASITFADAWSTPFGASTQTPRDFYFGGSGSATTNLVLKAGITEVKAYAFYKATTINQIHIPGTVATIGDYAFYCNLTAPNSSTPASVTVNRKTPPTTSTHSFSFNNSVNYTRIYVPEGAKNGYTSNPWYNGTGSTNQNTLGAQYIGRSGDVDRCSEKGFDISGTGYVYPVSGHVTQDPSDFQWNLSENGILTINGGSGTLPAYIAGLGTNTTTAPWYRFRHLINKIVIHGEEGDFSALSSAFQMCDGLIELEIDQLFIPSYTTLPASYLHTNQLTLLISTATIATTNGQSKLNSNSYRNMKQVISDQPVIISENADQEELLQGLHNCSYLYPFTMQFTRSLTNASYNTFCSPVPLTAAQLGGADIRALESTTYDDGSEELYLNFSSTPLSAVEAGIPYLIKPSSTISNPTFTDVDPGSVVVDPETVETSEVDFHGVLKPTTLTGGDKSILFLGAGNELFWPATTGDIKGLRAYFEIKEGSGARRAIRARMNMDGHSTPMNIKNVQGNNVQCTKILRDGKLYLMYEGKMYDVQGRLVD